MKVRLHILYSIWDSLPSSHHTWRREFPARGDRRDASGRLCGCPPTDKGRLCRADKEAVDDLVGGGELLLLHLAASDGLRPLYPRRGHARIKTAVAAGGRPVGWCKRDDGRLGQKGADSRLEPIQAHHVEEGILGGGPGDRCRPPHPRVRHRGPQRPDVVQHVCLKHVRDWPSARLR